MQQGHRTEKLIFCGFSFPQALQIAPEQGVMQPGESIPCFITLQPSGIASLCSIDLVCEVRPGRNVCIPIAAGAQPCSIVPLAGTLANFQVSFGRRLCLLYMSLTIALFSPFPAP